MIFEKIGPQHLDRKAILYVRQSSAHQVLHNRESSVLQYAMRDRLVALGRSNIEIVDDGQQIMFNEQIKRKRSISSSPTNPPETSTRVAMIRTERKPL